MGYREVAKRLAELSAMEVRVGWFDTSKYPDGTPVALVATTQEFGSTKKSIPPRPFVRPAINEGRAEWSAAAARGFVAVGEGRFTADGVLTLLGEAAAGMVRQKISEVNAPALQEPTLRARRKAGIAGTKPLVATTLMITSCTYLVTRS